MSDDTVQRKRLAVQALVRCPAIEDDYAGQAWDARLPMSRTLSR